MSAGGDLTISRRAAEALRLQLIELDHHIEDIQARTRSPAALEACAAALEVYCEAMTLLGRIEAGEPDPLAPKSASAHPEKQARFLGAIRRLDQAARVSVLRKLYRSQLGLSGAALDAKLQPLLDAMPPSWSAEGSHEHYGEGVATLAAAADEATALRLGREIFEGASQ